MIDLVSDKEGVQSVAKTNQRQTFPSECIVKKNGESTKCCHDGH
jgi:hypothetical protein